MRISNEKSLPLLLGVVTMTTRVKCKRSFWHCSFSGRVVDDEMPLPSFVRNSEVRSFCKDTKKKKIDDDNANNHTPVAALGGKTN